MLMFSVFFFVNASDFHIVALPPIDLFDCEILHDLFSPVLMLCRVPQSVLPSFVFLIPAACMYFHQKYLRIFGVMFTLILPPKLWMPAYFTSFCIVTLASPRMYFVELYR